MIPLLGPLVSGVFDIGKQYFTNKAEKSKAKHEQELAVIKGAVVNSHVVTLGNCCDSFKSNV